MNFFLIGILVLNFVIVISRRVTSIVHSFMAQSFFLFLLTLYAGIKTVNSELYVIAAFIFLLKVLLIPYFLFWIIKKIKIDETLGLSISPMVSMIFAGFLSYLAYYLAKGITGVQFRPQTASLAIALLTVLSGLFVMVFRMKAIAQVVGLLLMENGLFLTAVVLCGDMPFFVEITIFFDIFVCAVILGIFIFRINELFTHIDIDKLNSLKG